MPKVTGRFYTFLVVALMMYLFANQTQVSWLYVTSALLAGVIPVSWMLNRSALGNITGIRTINAGDVFTPIHEGAEVNISLYIKAAPRRAAAHIDLIETCPLVAVDDEQRELDVFIPMLAAGNEVEITYTVTAYQRGLYHFPDVKLSTRAPFGLFSKNDSLAMQSSLLVYPEVKHLSALDLLDRQPAALLTNESAGIGNEVIGVRPYRTGDSPRHIHWRSVARTGRLISKEFAEETQPGVSIVIDRYLSSDGEHHAKHNPFEWGIKAAVSTADYARRRRYPVYLHSDDDNFPLPHGAVTWDALMQYTARLSSTDKPRLTEVIERGGMRQYVVVIVSTPDDALFTPIIGLKYSGANVLIVMPTSDNTLADALRSERIDVVELDYSKDWWEQLASYRSMLI